MNRDMDVIRKIVLASRDSDGAIKSIDGIDEKMFNFNAMLLDEAGLAECLIKMPGNNNTVPILAIVNRLTWNGFEFADSITDETIWNKAKEHLLKPASSWTFGLLFEYLKAEIKQKLAIE